MMAAAVIHVSIQDNVLSEEDWPIMRLVYDQYGELLEKTLVKEGVYSFDSHFSDIYELGRWLHWWPAEDEHPQVWRILVPVP